MRLWSEAFRDGEEIPLRYTKDGNNISPPFGWNGPPSETAEVALIFEGTTPATHEPWVHWLVYKIPADASSLPEGFKHKRQPEAPLHILQGANSLGNVGYDGPQGTIGRVFRYRIRLLALDTAMEAESGLARREFAAAIDGHVLAEAELHTHYERRA
jgi:Raf kinase inhibitor-like YbhB/YbcL family protein